MERLSCILLYLLFFTEISLAQKLSPEDAILKLYKEFPQEKVILNTSKTEYVAGETIFFKAYVLTGNVPSAISTNLYIQLLDRNKKVIAKDIIPNFKGSGNGSFLIPAFQAEDVYFVHAYTKWMLNFDNALHYLQPLKIYNLNSSNKIAAKPVEWTAAAYPESGILLSNVPSKVAIRLNSTGTLPEKWQAALFDKSENKQIASATVFNNQIGLIEFTPKAGTDYFIRVTDIEGVTKDVQLPEIQNSGDLVQISTTKDSILYKVIFRNSRNKGEEYKLIGTHQDEIIFSALIKKSKGFIEGSIHSKAIPDGIIQFVLFDEQDRHVTSRLAFNNHEQLNIKQPEILFDTQTFEPKKLNTWQVEIDTLSWYNYAVQVEDGSHSSSKNFISDLFLTSELFGKIENASWYFHNVDPTKARALDALLITEKWKRFDWNDITNSRFPLIQYIPENNYLTYKGTVRRGRKVEPLAPVNLIFRTKDSSGQFMQVTTDSSGSFYLDQIMFVDTVEVFYQLNSKKYNAKLIEIEFTTLNTFSPIQVELPGVPYQLVPRSKGDTLPTHINQASQVLRNIDISNEKYKMMQEVVIKTRVTTATEKLNNELTTGMFRSMNEVVFDFINDDHPSAMSAINILEWLQGRVAGLSIVNNGGVAIPLIRNSAVPIFIDEMRVDPEQLVGLNVNDIAMVKVFRGAFFGVAFGSDGAIAIYLKRGGMASRHSRLELPSGSIIGYSKQPELFAPDYNLEHYRNFTDQRQILFRPQLLYPDTNSKGTIRFFNNDIAEKYRITITGFTSEGLPVFLDKVITSNSMN